MSCPFFQANGIKFPTNCCHNEGDDEEKNNIFLSKFEEQTPSKEWKEVIGPNEKEENERICTKVIRVQRWKTETYDGVKGRPFHRRTAHAFPVTISILNESDLPEYCRYGIFSEPGKEFEGLLRFSNGNGSMDDGDSKPTMRGLALKVKGLKEAPSCLEDGTKITEQNFLMNALQSDFIVTAENLVDVACIAHRSGGNDKKLALGIIQEYGLFEGISVLKKFKKAKDSVKTFSDYATSWFGTALPHKCGPYAVKLKMEPTRALSTFEKGTEKFFFGDDIEKHLVEEGELTYDLQLQFFVDEKHTPIEDGTVEWTSEFQTVAKVTIKKESLQIANSEQFQNEIEKTSFNPWKGLEDHRPLGRIMRARKDAYILAAKKRNAV